MQEGQRQIKKKKGKYKPDLSGSVATIMLSDLNISFQLYDSVEEAAAIWNSIAPPDDLFLQTAFLQAFENAPPKGLRFQYMIFFKEEAPIGVAYFQFYHLFLKDSLGESVMETWLERLKAQFANRFSYRFLICGNLALTGPHNFHFTKLIGPEEGIRYLDEGIRWICEKEKAEGRPIQIVMFKDFFNSAIGDSEPAFKAGKYHNIGFQPSMILQLDPSWRQFEDYLDAMTSKYRVRARRAFKKGKALVRQSMNLRDLDFYKDKMHQLYKEVAAQADFNAVQHHPNYFRELKAQLGDRFSCCGYFIEDRMVGFRTTIHNGIELEAHFLGYELAQNRPNQLYLNMLYDMIAEGIQKQVHHIFFARTALEIKSSVGAVAHEMACFVRHNQRLANLIMPFVVRFMEPKVEWTPRRPFKK